MVNDILFKATPYAFIRQIKQVPTESSYRQSYGNRKR